MSSLKSKGPKNDEKKRAVERCHSFKNKEINTAIDTWGSLLWETELAAFKNFFVGEMHISALN